MAKHLCIFGEVLFDIFPDGNQVLGGAPFNVAWHLQAFGQSPVFISRVGTDPQGDTIRQAMIDRGMDISALQTDDSLPTGRVTIQLKDGEPVYDIVSPCAYDAIESPPAAIPDCHFFYHGSLALRHAQSAHALDQYIKSRPDRIFVDVNLRPPWWDKDTVLKLISQADWTKLNTDEFSLLYPGPDPIAERLPAFVNEYELQGIILTHGSKGAEVLTEDGGHFTVKPQLDVSVVDTVGAGDAFTSVMITGIVNNWPMQITLDRAQAFASNIVGRRGATVDDPDFYRLVMDHWQSD